MKAFNPSQLIKLPFDQYQRYKMVEELVNLLRGRENMTMLDVGGRPGLLGKFLPKDKIFNLDVEKGNAKNFIVGNGCRLPFKDKSFDIVISVDVLEHVPFKNKPKFLEEVLRVSRRFNIIGAPYHDNQVLLAEKILYDFIYSKYGIKYKLLEEHFNNKLPILEATEQYIKDKGFDCIYLDNGYLYNWLFMMLINFYFEWMDSSKSILPRINEFYNANFYKLDNKSPSYRKVIVSSKDKSFDLKNILDIYKNHEKDNDSSPKLELANLLMKLIGAEEIRDKEEEVKKLKSNFQEKIDALEKWNKVNKKRLEEELDKTVFKTGKEIGRLNKEIKQLHLGYSKKIRDTEKSYSQKLKDSQGSNDKEKLQFTTETSRLNEEIKKLHSSYSVQIDKINQEKDKLTSSLSKEIERLNLEKDKSVQILSKEADRLNKEIESLHKSYSQKLKDSEGSNDKEKLQFTTETSRLNEEIKKLHSSYSTQIDKINQEKDKLTSSLSKEIERLNQEIREIHLSYSRKIENIIAQKNNELELAKKEIFSLKETNLDNIKDFVTSGTLEIRTLIEKEVSDSNKRLKELYDSDLNRLKQEMQLMKDAYSSRIKNTEDQNKKLSSELNKIHATFLYKLYKTLKLDKRN